MKHEDKTWLASSYHFPGTYSIRVPMTSPNNALAMPAPGPGMVRCATIRTALELFDLAYVRDDLFPIICSVPVLIRPPEAVAISVQRLQVIKTKKEKQRTRFTTSIAYREHCYAKGVMTVYLQVPDSLTEIFAEILWAIGYWGQSGSLTSCMKVEREVPDPDECAQPLGASLYNRELRSYFYCAVSEFRDGPVSWQAIAPQIGGKAPDFLQLKIYVWPMIFQEQYGGHKLLTRCPLGH